MRVMRADLRSPPIRRLQASETLQLQSPPGCARYAPSTPRTASDRAKIDRDRKACLRRTRPLLRAARSPRATDRNRADPYRSASARMLYAERRERPACLSTASGPVDGLDTF